MNNLHLPIALWVDLCYNYSEKRKRKINMITNTTNIRISQIKDVFTSQGYKVLYLKDMWVSTVETPTSTYWPECFENNVVNRATSGDLYGGAWSIVLLKPDFREKLDDPYIFATLYDLKVDTLSNDKEQAKLEDVWFEFTNQIYQDAPKKFIAYNYNLKDDKTKEIKAIDLRKKEDREALIAINKDEIIPEVTRCKSYSRSSHVGVQKPINFDFAKNYAAKNNLITYTREVEIEEMIRERAAKKAAEKSPI